MLATKAITKRVNTHRRGEILIGPGKPFVCPSLVGRLPAVKRTQRSEPNNRDAGFTLVELIATVLIAGALTAVAAPTMTNFIKSNRLTTQANALIADLRFARSEAIKRHEEITVCRASQPFTACDHSPGSWDTGWVVLDAAGEVLRIHEALDGAYTFTGTAGVDSLGDRLVYTSDGTTLFAQIQTFSLCDNRGEPDGKTIQVAVTGRLHIDQNPPADC